MECFRTHFKMDEKINEKINIPVRQLRWKLLVRPVKLLMNSQRRTPHVPCKMLTHETNARDVICLSALVGNRRLRKNQQFAQQKEQERERERERETRDERNQKKKERKKHSYLRGSALNLWCDGVVHRAAPSILFPPVDLWRTMHYVNCERAAGDRGKRNNSELRRVGIALRQSERHAAGWLAATDRTAATLDLHRR